MALNCIDLVLMEVILPALYHNLTLTLAKFNFTYTVRLKGNLIEDLISV